jgi:rhomboid protease GluP
MALGGFNCPFCNAYNAKGERSCFRCKRVLPPEGLAGPLRVLRLSEFPATKVLAAISIVVFGLQFADAMSINELSGHALSGSGFRGMPYSTMMRFGAIDTATAWSEPWRWLAACYIHGGILHLIMNMAALVDLGRQGEERVGSGLLAVTYVLTGVFGFVVSNLWYGNSPYVTMGASGAIFGLLGLVAGECARRKDKAWKEMVIRAVLLSFIYYLVMKTNQAAHLGGLALGGLIGYFATHRLTLRAPVILTIAGGLGVVLSIAALLPPQWSPIWREIRTSELHPDD